MSKAVISINHQPSGGSEWVAEITGRDPKYGVARRFLAAVSRNWSASGKTGTTSFELEPGRLYQVKPAWKNRYYLVVDADGGVRVPGLDEVVKTLDDLDARKEGVSV